MYLPVHLSLLLVQRAAELRSVGQRHHPLMNFRMPSDTPCSSCNATK